MRVNSCLALPQQVVGMMTESEMQQEQESDNKNHNIDVAAKENIPPEETLTEEKKPNSVERTFKLTQYSQKRIIEKFNLK